MRLTRWIAAVIFTLGSAAGLSTVASAQEACVPPEIDATQYVVGGQLNLDAYLSAVAAANAICEGAQAAGVSLVPDTVAPVDQTIGPDGGTITVTSSSGVVYRLVVPAGALDEPVTITIRPVTLTTSAGTSVAAVQFTPEGLQFDPAATLSITFPDSTPDPLYVYRYEGVGTNLTQVSVGRSGADTVTVPVPHFSGVAAFTSATDGGGGSLPTTGSRSAALVPWGVALVGLGFVAVGAARSRRRNVA